MYLVGHRPKKNYFLIFFQKIMAFCLEFEESYEAVYNIKDDTSIKKGNLELAGSLHRGSANSN